MPARVPSWVVVHIEVEPLPCGRGSAWATDYRRLKDVTPMCSQGGAGGFACPCLEMTFRVVRVVHSCRLSSLAATARERSLITTTHALTTLAARRFPHNS